MKNLTFEEWEKLSPKDRALYNLENIDTDKFVKIRDPYTKDKRITNLEFWSKNRCEWREAFYFNSFDNYFYRLKPEPAPPQYRPFESIAEFAPHWNKQGEAIVVKDTKLYENIDYYDVDTDGLCLSSGNCEYSFQELFEDYEFIDLATGERKPFGVEV